MKCECGSCESHVMESEIYRITVCLDCNKVIEKFKKTPPIKETIIQMSFKQDGQIIYEKAFNVKMSIDKSLGRVIVQGIITWLHKQHLKKKETIN